MAGMDHGSAPAAEAGHLIADALVLPPGSSWDATVRILSGPDGLELSRQRYSFAMGEAGVSGGRVASLFDPGTAVAALLVVAGALSLGLGVGGTRLPRCEAAASRVALLGAGTVAVALGVVIGLGRLAAVG